MFVEEGELSRQEREIFKLTPKLFELVQVKNPPKVRVSETLRADLYDTRGVWDVTSGCIVIKRSALSSATEYAGVLLHEVAHATTGALDATRNFENVLTDYLGSTGSRAV
jgi:Zn-dependent protease with chaperone function